MKNHANIAAAHSVPTTFAVATLRSLTMRSGISGSRTRDSIRTKSASSAAAATSSPTVCADVQPFELPFTIA